MAAATAAAPTSVAACFVAMNDLLQVLTAPGLSWFRFVVFVPVLVLLVRRRAWWTAAWLITAIGLIGPLNTLLKNYFGRVRPDFAQGGARLDSLSFPSGHSSGIATLVTVALVLAWQPVARRLGVLVDPVGFAQAHVRHAMDLTRATEETEEHAEALADAIAEAEEHGRPTPGTEPVR